MANEAEQQVSQDTSVDETTADSQSEDQTQDSSATSTEQAGESTASTGDTKQSETQDSKPDQKPVSRRSAAYRIQQLVNENNELKKQVRQPQKEQDEWEDTTAEQNDTQPDIASLVAKEVERRLNPIVSESTKAADDAELSELFSGDKAAERTKYESKIRDMWKLPQYKDVAAQDLYKIASFNDAVATATAKAIEDYKQAEREAKESSAGGSTNTSNRTRSGSDLSNLSDQELLERNEKIKAGIKV